MIEKRGGAREFHLRLLNFPNLLEIDESNFIRDDFPF